MELKQVYVTDALGKRLMVRMLDSQSGKLNPISIDTYIKQVTPLSSFTTHIENNLCYLDTYIGTDSNVVIPTNDGQGHSTILTNEMFAESEADILSIDFNNVPFVDNDMNSVLCWYGGIQTITGLNDNITNMESAFFIDDALINAPTIPANANNMSYTFSYCFSLVNAPVIPNKVTNMDYTFNGCSSLTGNIYIQSSIVETATDVFGESDLDKDVYIPFYNQDGSETTTFKSFKSAGYSTTRGQNGVILKDINNL